jgi:hypothetical protein
MKFKTNTGSLLFNSKLAEESDEQAPEVSLYDELLAFSTLLPEEQEAQASKPPAPIPPARPASAPLPSLSLVSSERPSGPLRSTASLQPPKRTPTSELPPSRVITTPSAQAYDRMKELAFELTNRAIETAFEGTKPLASESVRKSTKELTPVPALVRAPVVDDDHFDLHTANIFSITGPLPATRTHTSAPLSLTTCANCGNQADSDEMFCITCGELLEESQAPAVDLTADVACEDCGAVVAGEDIFCPSCGSVISGA